ncbi:hypothetical protein GCM10007874_54340 [Labrys miyagiensis]|uniref:Uncharacterized protein n=1 Tax=Labrys miyagiensis TaxID=346912 RepID=A0ABQ6CVZ3_9HYPH|nr:hypothetical protein GCM10007874_54340 [Labrys miyagiensis]
MRYGPLWPRARALAEVGFVEREYGELVGADCDSATCSSWRGACEMPIMYRFATDVLGWREILACLDPDSAREAGTQAQYPI